MRKLMALGLAGALATASVGVTVPSAQASTAGQVALGVVIGVGVLALIHHYHPFATTFGDVTYSDYPDGGHVAWCQSHYRSYNLTTDSFMGYDGYAHRCVSPY